MNNIQSEIKTDENKSPLNHLLVLAGVNDNKRLSERKSGMPCRYPLAFFVPETFPATQTGIEDSTIHLPQFTGENHHILDVLIFERILDVSIFGYIASYDGVTLQNKPLWRICEAVAFTTESEPHHPMIFHSVVITQNVKGGHIHA